MKLKEIKEKEEFICNGIVFSFSLDGKIIKFTPLRRHDGKVKKEKEFIPPTSDEVMSFFFEKGYESMTGLKFWEYYDAAEWRDGKGNQVKNWKQKAVGVWFKPENKRKEPSVNPKQELIL